MSFRFQVLVAASLLALSGCGSKDAPSVPKPPGPSAATVRMVDPSISKSDLPPGCSLPEVERIFDGLLTGANTGNRSLLLRRIASQPELTAFFVGRDSGSPTGNSGLTLRTPDAIYRYFADQSRQGYRRHLRRALVQPINPGHGHRSGPFRRPATGSTADDPVVAVGFDVTVTNKEGADTNLAGKAGINCETGRFYMYGGG